MCCHHRSEPKSAQLNSFCGYELRNRAPNALEPNWYNTNVSERKRYPENAPGHFYVETDLCIQCGNAPAAAPGLVEMNEDHCYFKTQPSTETELKHAIEAVNGCCCGAYRYGGDHPDVIARLSEDACDKPRRIDDH